MWIIYIENDIFRRKRKLSDPNSDSKPSSAKRLYTSSSPIQNNPLDLEQKEVLEACLSGRNIFFTGSAGTGKSFLLRKIIGALPADVTVATASTGVAACHIGGITLHQFAGIGLGTASIDKCVDMATKSASYMIWKKCKHLIIDEVSMIDADFFEVSLEDTVSLDSSEFVNFNRDKTDVTSKNILK